MLAMAPKVNRVTMIKINQYILAMMQTKMEKEWQKTTFTFGINIKRKEKIKTYAR